MSSSSPPESFHILLVENDPGDGGAIEACLSGDGAGHFRLRRTAALAEALEILGGGQVDAVLLDLSLPGAQCIGTLARLRAAHPLVPVVVLTGNGERKAALEALRHGAQDYLVKGGDGELMRRAIHYAIERSRVDQELRRSEARFRAVFANAGVGVALMQADGRFIACNPAFCGFLGHDEEALKSLSIRDVTHPDDRGKSDEPMAEILAGSRDGFALTSRYVARDGRVVWGRLTVTSVRDEDSGQLRFTVAIVEDVTERMRLEDHMRLAASVFENSGEGLFVTDADRRIIMVNPAFTEITGYDAADVLGGPPRILSSGRHDGNFYTAMWRALNSVGRWQGEIWNRRKSGEMFAAWVNINAVRDAGGEVCNYVAVFSDITLRKQVEERLSYLANHDPLTRLPNRTLFHERLSRALARAQRDRRLAALLFIDLDHFKEVNDTLGHLAGDRLLQQVAQRLSGCVRQGDTVSRLGGDEFTVVLEDVGEARDVAVVAHKILHAMAEPFDLGGQSARIGSSIGVALYPVDAEDAQTLIRLADAAMYRAKNMGRNACRFHSEAVDAQAFQRLALESHLDRALERGEFIILYQPVFDLGSGRLVAVEALLRWQHPDLGPVDPRQFLPLLDETGQALTIASWVMDTVFAQVRDWRQGGADLNVVLGLSAGQVRDAALRERMNQALQQSGLPPAAVEVEVSEGHIVGSGASAVVEALRCFQELGMGVSVAEAGAGHSSLDTLRRLSPRSLKVARMLAPPDTPGRDDMIAAIAALAHALRMTVVVPGITSRDQLAGLKGLGCDRVQGHGLAPAMTAREMTQFLSGPAGIT